MYWLIIGIVFIISILLTGLIRVYAIRRNLLDVPNRRSSHTVPTPRGGGLSIVIVCLVSIMLLVVDKQLSTSWGLVTMLALAWVALTGFLDDHRHIAARWRLLSQFAASILLVYWMGGLPEIKVMSYVINLGFFGDILLVIGLVWLINLFNFMDGIDGIACIETLSSSFIVGLIFIFIFDSSGLATLNIIVGASTAGFLYWNFPPAKIFLGDVGSGFLGLMLGALMLASTYVIPQMFWVWLILLGVFIVDATYTLLSRLLRGEKVYHAHCSHAYQCAARRYDSHLTISLSVLLINVLWLAPWAVSVALAWVDGITAIFITYIPLVVLARYFSAGK
ncbi:Undecaprenyl-phosphate alpha-N-acetylglucosaminyl 1-phosphate transferase [hydrothermal vent metagenome]|uniref:Undecaprenyl-phosphate alpha-N-acetylglucosaminyl 1-phosphate transferase n=1 Tax=hydrothermal vent metagenome TaxID=652676 RepID=A0A3B0Z0N8_9ZZZZ